MTSATVATPVSAGFKPRDVEELIDFYLHRRAANVVLRLLVKTPITPNQVTVLSGVTAIVAGVVMGTASSVRPWLLFLGAAIFFLSIVLDCVDGQLARVKQMSSFAGRALDGYTDVVSAAALFFGQLPWLLAHGCPLWLTQVVGWGAALSFKWQTHAYDHVKNLYVYNTEARGPGEVPWFPSIEDIERERAEHERAGRWFSAILCRGFRQFTEAQRRGITDSTGVDRPSMQTPAERELYRGMFRWYVRLWTFNGLGTHLELFLLATVLAPLVPLAPLYAWAFLLVPMNVFTLGLRLYGARLEARLAAALKAGQLQVA